MDKVIDDNKNTNLKNPKYNEIRFSSSNDIDTTIPLRDTELPIPVTTVDILKGKKVREIHGAWLSCLWDGGASDSMVKKSYVRKFRDKFKHNLQVYDTAAGKYTSEYEVKINFTMPEFSGSKIIKHKFQVDNEDVNANIGYDMIKLGCITDFKRNLLTWEDISVPMRSAYTDTDKPRFSCAEIHEIIKWTAEPLVTQEATERAIKILDSNYEAADLDKIARSAEHLDDEQKANKLLVLLKDYEDIFDGTLGKWKTEPVEIEIKTNDKPVSSRYYPVPHINNKATFKKELLRLVDIGVLEPVQSSEYGTLVFIIPKKEGTVRFLSNYRCLNQTNVRKPYLIPRIGDTMQQLEGFQYATALDLNIMGYYTIQLAQRIWQPL